MLPRLMRRVLLAVLMTTALVVPASSQPPVANDPSLSEGGDPGLAPLWDGGPARVPGHRAAHTNRARLAPFVTSSMPEDAAWEGFITPASNWFSALTFEFQGKLVMENNGIAGATVSPVLATWDGTSFE